MFENINNFFKKLFKIESSKEDNSGKEAKERLHLVLMQDRANVSADFLEMMKQEIIEVIKKYIDVDENQIDVRLTNQENNDGSKGAPALYANIPIVNIKEENQKKLNNVGVGATFDQNKLEQSNENMSNDVGVGATFDPNQTQSSNENTSNNVGVETHDDQNQIQQSNENTSNDVGVGATFDPNQTQPSNEITSNNIENNNQNTIEIQNNNNSNNIDTSNTQENLQQSNENVVIDQDNNSNQNM